MFQRDGKFIGLEEYRRLLTQPLPVAEFEEILMTEIVINKLVSSDRRPHRHSRGAVAEYRKTNAAKLEYVMLERARLLRRPADPADLRPTS
jgi:hypothetical protein